METFAHIEVSFVSDVGRKRRRNEDAVLVRKIDSGGLLMAVADGMGGYTNGHLASRAAIAALAEGLTNVDVPDLALVASVQDAHERIRKLSRHGDRAARMGTTLVACVLRGRQAYFANVGDCRAYLVTSESIEQVTVDHSLVAEQVRAGLLSDAEARTSPLRSMVTRDLGLNEQAPNIDSFGPIEMGCNQWIILCSDGLHSVLTDEEIASEIRRTSPQEASQDLVRTVNNRGGPDNISVVIVRTGSAISPTTP